jgi:hypothetical protein
MQRQAQPAKLFTVPPYLTTPGLTMPSLTTPHQQFRVILQDRASITRPDLSMPDCASLAIVTPRSASDSMPICASLHSTKVDFATPGIAQLCFTRPALHGCAQPHSSAPDCSGPNFASITTPIHSGQSQALLHYTLVSETQPNLARNFKLLFVWLFRWRQKRQLTPAAWNISAESSLIPSMHRAETARAILHWT